MIKPQLRVAWDNSLARRDQAGTGVYAARLVEQLADRADLDFQVLNGWQINTGRKFANRVLRTVQDFIWTHVRMPNLLWKKNFDLLHAPAFVAPLLSPCPVVVTVHDVTYLLYPKYFARWWVAYMNAVMFAAVKTESSFICVSDCSKQDFLASYSASPSQVHVVYNGIDHERFNPAASLETQWARRHGIRGEYILHVGTLSHRKNIPTLLQAVALLRSKGKWQSRQLILVDQAIRPLSELMKFTERFKN